MRTSVTLPYREKCSSTSRSLHMKGKPATNMARPVRGGVGLRVSGGDGGQEAAGGGVV